MPGLSRIKFFGAQAFTELHARAQLVAATLPGPAERRLHADWDDTTAGVVGGLRQIAGGEMVDPRLGDVVDELCANSDRFRMLWLRADVGYRPAGSSRMHHPLVGDLLLRRNRFPIPDSDGQHLQIYHPMPGTDTAVKLASLADT